MKKTCCLWLSVLVLFGCARVTAPNILEVQAAGTQQTVVNDQRLAKKLAFGEVSLRNPGGGQVAQVIIQNQTRRDVAFEYRFVWYDAGGFETSALTAWIPATLSGGEGRGFTSTAPMAQAVSFKLMIRAPHPLADRSQ